MKTNAPVLAIIAILATMVMVGASSSLVAAQIPGPCTATLSYPVTSTLYTNSNVQFVVPISASCTTLYGAQLYATGTAYDTTANVALGSASGVLTSANGGTIFNGQLGFNLPPTTQGDSVQISAAIYNGQYGSLITATSETVQLGTATQQTVTTTVTQAEYPYSDSYPTLYLSQPDQPTQLQSHHSAQAHYEPQPVARATNYTNLYGYIAIIAILATAIIATTGLVLVARREAPWPQTQYAPPR